ncbi:protein TORNADO 1-like [Polyodon spathula]|uniref:protein TORNADO 1-like n=1 Tax=Polyodon spathula TaxID=7913 RepID=UPI001B7F054D|nr:protein TORNADO 1-like [Polyodon spathula]XP_041110750.1 protein TORNADO 1-like [Polyodon spathula]
MQEEEFLKNVKVGSLRDVQNILKGNVNVNYCDQFSNTALHYAAFNRNRELAHLLVEAGGDILKENTEGLTPFHFAAFGGSKEVLNIFLQKKPEALNCQKPTRLSSPLHEAVIGKTVDVVEFLLQKTADCNLQNQEGYTPLHLAASQKSEAMCCKLLESGANVELKNKKGDTCLHLAAESAALSICQRLVAKEASLQAKNKKGETVIFSALRGAGSNTGADYTELISWLIEENPTLLLNRNKDGLTALDVAREIHIPLSINKLIQQKTQELLQQDLLKKSKVTDRGVVKLFVCGNSRVGKTTLTQTLQKDGFLSQLQHCIFAPCQPPSTQGVQISQSNLAAGKVVIWDFAGQMEYYFTHSLLLSTECVNALYCIVFSLEQIQCDKAGGQSAALDQVLYWLRFLTASRTNSDSNRAKVFLIGSHYDKLEMDFKDDVVKHFFDLLHIRACKLSPYLDIDTAVISVNCTSPSDLKPLRQRLEEHVSKLQQVTANTPFPEICSDVMDEVQSIRCKNAVKYMFWKEFSTYLCKNMSENVSIDTLKTAVDYLHNISELIFFPKVLCSESDAGLVILDVQWLCQDIFGMFGSFPLSKLPFSKMKWTTNEVASALKIEKSKDVTVIIQLLEMLELVFTENEGEYIVPSWLKEGKPQNVWRKEKCFNVYYGTSYQWRSDIGLFSQAFFARLQLRLMKHFTLVKRDGPTAEKFIIWINGLKYSDTTEALVQLSQDHCSINIAVRGYKAKRSESSNRDTREKCFKLLEEVSCEVQRLLLETGTKQEWQKLYLSPKDLEDKMDASDDGLATYTKEEILQSEKSGEKLYNKSSVSEEYACDVLIAGYDTTVLESMRWEASLQWLSAGAIEQLCSLDKDHPLGLYWKAVMEKLDECTIQDVEKMDAEAKQTGTSPTVLLLTKYHRTTIRDLYNALEQLHREDCMNAIETMFNNLPELL